MPRTLPPEDLVDLVPPFVHPLRVPAEVLIHRAEPEFAIAGETGDFDVPLVLTRAIGPDEILKLQWCDHRNNKPGFDNLHANEDEPLGLLSLHMPDGAPLALAPDDKNGTARAAVPAEGLEADTRLLLRLHSAKANTPKQLNKFFVLYVADEPDFAPRGWSAEDSPRIVAAGLIHILGGPVHHITAHAPSHVIAGRTFDLLVRPQDQYTNIAGKALRSAHDIELTDAGSPLPFEVEMVAESTAVALKLTLTTPGVHRLTVTDPASGLTTTSNPVICLADEDGPPPPRLLWGNIHGHTEMSDGSGDLDNFFRQLRDEATLDFGAVSDHDHLYETSDEFWQTTCAAVRRWNEAHRFVTFPGYEWAKWRRLGEADRNVYFRQDDRPMYRSDDGHYAMPPELFAALEENDEQAMVIPHHTGHAASYCDWKDHDPKRERLVEIFQVRGSYECTPDEGNVIPERGGKEPPLDSGNVNQALALGWRVGFTAGGDDHFQHAGMGWVPPKEANNYNDGAMAVLASECTRDAIWEALYERRVVATSMPRISLLYTVNDHLLGSELSVADEPGLQQSRKIHVECHGTADIARVDIIRSNKVAHTVTGSGPDLVIDWEDTADLQGCSLPPAAHCDHPFVFYYVRCLQTDGEMAWASPIWIDP